MRAGRRRLLAGLALLPWAALPCAAVAQAASKLRVAIEGAYPPFSEVDSHGGLKGFDVDIARALCKQLGVECVLVQMDWDGMIPALQARKFDAIVASMGITPERRRSVAFTDKYYGTPSRLVGPAGTALQGTPEGMQGKRIGVQRGTTHDRFLTARFARSEIVRYARQDEAFLDLAAHRVDALMLDSVAADIGFLQTPPGRAYAFFGPKYDDPAYFGDGNGIAVRLSDDALRVRLNDAIRALRANGVYQQIQSKYFAYDVYGPPPK